MESVTTTKPSHDWDESDVLALIRDGVAENVNLDYKRSGALGKAGGRKREISKDASAFANSAGGTILYGVVEEEQVPTEIDGGVDGVDLSREWLENVVNSTIQPRIDGVRINQIALRDSPGRVLYTVNVPKSVGGGPHQAKDHRYYKRFNFQSVPMEDYEIRDVMRRGAGPDLYCDVALDRSTHSVDLSIALGNRSDEPALYAHIDAYMDASLELMESPFLSEVRRARPLVCYFGKLDRATTQLRAPWLTPNMPPIWKGLDQELGDEPIRFNASVVRPPYYLTVVLNAPHMESKTSVFELDPDVNPYRRVKRRDDLHFRILDD